MNILNFLNPKRKAVEKKQKAMDTTVNKIVHDKRNQFQNHLSKIQRESSMLTERIEEAKKSKVRLNKLLSTTEMIFLSSGGKLVHNGKPIKK